MTSRIPRPLLRIISALLLWIGTSFTLVFFVGVVVGIWILLTGSPRVPPNVGTPLRFLLNQGGGLFFGVAMLVLGYKIGKASDFAVIDLLGSTPKSARADKWRAIFHPTPDDRLNHWSIEFGVSPDEIKSRLEDLPRLPLFRVLGLLTLDKGQPALRLRGARWEVMAPGSGITSPIWVGILSGNDEGQAVLRGAIKMPPIYGFDVFQSICLLIVALIAFLSGCAMVLSSQWEGFLFLLSVPVIWLFATMVSRVERWNARRHERQLEVFFRDYLGAQSIELKPRLEIFSLDWFKNFRQNR